MHAELVSVTTPDGFRLDGAFFSNVSHATSAVLCIHGATGNFYNPSFFETAVEEFTKRGIAVLRVNTRGHDIAYPTPKGYMGAAYELMDDARKDVTSWLDFLESRGIKKIGLWGHSLGAVKTIYCLARDADPRVAFAIASSPPRINYKNHAEAPDKGSEFIGNIAKAEAAIKAGRPWELMMVSTPLPGVFSAGCYRDKYGPEDNFDYWPLLDKIPVPFLITLGATEVGTYYDDLKSKGDAKVNQLERMSYIPVDGADHLYTGKYAELWKVVESWLDQTVTL